MLNETRFDQGQRENRFDALVRQNVDAARAARFVLGHYWNSSTDIECRRFAEVYAGHIAHTYAKVLPYLNGATIKVVRISENGDEIEVKTLFNHDHASRPPVCWDTTVYRSDPMCRDADTRWAVDWLLHRTSNGFEIVDVEGESLLLNERNEFASLIKGAPAAQSRGLRGLLKHWLSASRVAEQQPRPVVPARYGRWT